jgi:hypothetical protein
MNISYPTPIWYGVEVAELILGFQASQLRADI